MNNKSPRLFMLNKQGYGLAKQCADGIEGLEIYAPSRFELSDCFSYDQFSQIVQSSFRAGHPIIALCASGIIIRILAPLLADKFVEPPVITVAEDGHVCVPLLGANSGANELAQKLANLTGGVAAVTTSGELRFGINLLNPPDELELLNKPVAKAFIAKLLNGEHVEIKGNHPWFDKARLPIGSPAPLKIFLEDEPSGVQPTRVRDEIDTLYYRRRAKHPVSRRGALVIIGLGPGDKNQLTLAARMALSNAQDIYGYHYYVDLAGPYRSDQVIHGSDNRQELDRAAQAFAAAIGGRQVAIISSGDPGIFAMASAVMEYWYHHKEFENIDVTIEPGISAAMATAAKVGAPLGHDFAVISLSDNLKKWSIIEQRIISALRSDFVMAFYNPVSKARPEGINRCIALLHKHCAPERVVIIGTDVGREQEQIKIVTLNSLCASLITSRSVLIVGSSRTKVFNRNGRLWSYTPRNY